MRAHTAVSVHRVARSIVLVLNHDDVIKWKHFPCYWPFVRGIHRSPVNSPHKGQWRGALMFSLIYAWTNGWVNHRYAGDLRLHRAHNDVTVMRLCTTMILSGYLTAYIMVLLDPVLLTHSPWQLKFDRNFILISYKLHWRDRYKFCTYQNSCTVVACAKIGNNLMASNRDTSMWFFHRLWIANEKDVSGMSLCEKSSSRASIH